MLEGTSKEQYDEIIKILKKYQGDFYAYGSRTRKDYTKASDLDILVKAENYDDFIYELKDDFDSSSLPFVVNFVNFSEISEKFYKLIEKDLTKLTL